MEGGATRKAKGFKKLERARNGLAPGASSEVDFSHCVITCYSGNRKQHT